MKLKDWSKKQGISYLTAYRWFKSGKLPVKAYQSETGTIIVEESNSSDNGVLDSKEGSMFNSDKDITVEIFKKMASLSKEEFAYYILSNFKLEKLNKENKRNTHAVNPIEHLNNCLSEMVSHQPTVRSTNVLENSPEDIESALREDVVVDPSENIEGAIFLTLEDSKKIKDDLKKSMIESAMAVSDKSQLKRGRKKKLESGDSNA